MFYDKSGKVIATEGVRLKDPWEVSSSRKHKGRFYFFNGETNQTFWSLDPEMACEIILDAQKAEERKSEVNSKSIKSLFEPKKEKSENPDTRKYIPATLKRPTLPSIRASRGVSFKQAWSSSCSNFQTALFSSSASSGRGMNEKDEPLELPRRSWHGSKSERRASSRDLRSDSSTSEQLPSLTKADLTREQLVTGYSNNLFAEDNRDDDPSDGISPSFVPVNETFNVVDGLGSGGFAVVVKVRHVHTGQEFAMKVIPKKKLKRARERERLFEELRVMTELAPSPFLQRCHFSFESQTCIFFINDLVLGGDLFYHLVNQIKSTGTGFPEHIARTILVELFLALEHMHNNGFVHRDIKVENIMLDPHGHVKLIDFGLSSEINAEVGPMSAVGSLIYMAPELIRESKGGRHTDWWAFGILAYEIFTGRTPWSSLTDKEIIKNEIQTINVSPPRRISSTAGRFVCSFLRAEVAKRLGTASDSNIRSSPFFESINWDEAARCQLQPAFSPGIVTLPDADREKTITTYLSFPEEASDTTWFNGLNVVHCHPVPIKELL